MIHSERTVRRSPISARTILDHSSITWIWVHRFLNFACSSTARFVILLDEETLYTCGERQRNRQKLRFNISAEDGVLIIL